MRENDSKWIDGLGYWMKRMPRKMGRNCKRACVLSLHTMFMFINGWKLSSFDWNGIRHRKSHKIINQIHDQMTLHDSFYQSLISLFVSSVWLLLFRVGGGREKSIVYIRIGGRFRDMLVFFNWNEIPSMKINPFVNKLSKSICRLMRKSQFNACKTVNFSLSILLQSNCAVAAMVNGKGDSWEKCIANEWERTECWAECLWNIT